MSRYVINLQNSRINESIEVEENETPVIYSVCATDCFEKTYVFEFTSSKDAESFIGFIDYDIERTTTDTGLIWGYKVDSAELEEKEFEYENVIYYVAEGKAEDEGEEE